MTSTTTKPHVLTDADHAQLLENGRRQAEARAQGQEIDFVPVVKLYTPLAPARWLLTEIEPDDPDVAFGLCDLGFGQAEIGSVYLPDIAEADGRLRVARDDEFAPALTLDQYAKHARAAGGICG